MIFAARSAGMMKGIGNGQLPPTLQIRSKDYLKAEVEVLNAMVAGLSDQVERIQTANQTLQDRLATCQDDASQYGNEQIQSSLRSACASAQDLSLEIAFFQREHEEPQACATGPATAMEHASIAP